MTVRFIALGQIEQRLNGARRANTLSPTEMLVAVLNQFQFLLGGCNGAIEGFCFQLAVGEETIGVAYAAHLQ